MKKICTKAAFVTALILLTNFLSVTVSAQCIYFKKLAKGADATHCVGIATDGTLWAWGSNQFGAVGNNSLVSVSEPVQISSVTGWKEVANGNGHSLAIDSKGKLWAWGRDDEGELGDGAPEGTTHNILAPEHIISSDSIWMAVAACAAHSFGITADGKLWGWGYSIFYNAGGAVPNTPIQIGTDSDWAAISVGQVEFIAIKKDSTLWGWGRNGEGEAGDSTTAANIYAPPVEIDSNHSWAAVSAGSNFTLALKYDGTLWSWGVNNEGQLGNSTTTNGIHGPKQIGTKKWKAVSAGLYHSLGIDINGRRWAWGENSSGEYGNDSSKINGSIYSTVPILIDSSNNWKDVVAAYQYSLNLTNDGSAWSSGTNDFENLGDGTTTQSFTLIRVGTPNPYTALATSGAGDTEYQRAYNYYTTDCTNLITEVFKTGSHPIHANTTAKIWIDETVKNDGTGKPYVQRHYEIHPANNDTTATGTVNLYFTQDEFTAYNASINVMNGTYPMLPVDATDAQGYRGNLRVERILAISNDESGNLDTYKGTSVLITPTSVIYVNGRWQVDLNVTGFGGFFATTGATLLPVSWLNVNGNLNSNNQAVISWKVNEYNTSKYDVEKSYDGISFNSIAILMSKSNGINTYQYADNLKVAGSLFYRIKQTDKDGKFNYSSVITLNNNQGSSAVNLYPNPTSEYIFINGLSGSRSYQISVTDVSGKSVLNKNIIGTQNKILLNNLNNGIYFIKITDDRYSKTLKFVKQ